MVTDRLAGLVSEALGELVREEGAAPEDLPAPQFDRPKRREHGDWSTNVALVAGKGSRNPRELAAALVDRMPASELVERVEVAGPGFINFHLSPSWLHDVVRRAIAEGAGFGRRQGQGERVDVEYVSANPTGPINVVSGRHAAVGDAISNLLEATGHDVTREFYINDTGRQIDLFVASLEARYLQHFGRDASVPQEGYQGAYVAELAAALATELGDSLLDEPEESRRVRLRELGLERMLAAARATLARFGTRYDVWFPESSLHDSGRVAAAIEHLGELGHVYERDGATWFRSSELGDDKDRVLVRADGSPTYLASDVAYLLDKFGRGFDRLLYLLGPDHHGTVPRFTAATRALGFAPERAEFLLAQVVLLLEGGAAIKGSKRAGVIVALDELIDEVGSDVARYTFLTRSLDSPLEFDVALAKEQAPENPVYYVQYAHARICSIVRNASAQGIEVRPGDAALELLVHPSEDELMRKLATYEELVPEAARARAPQKVARYVEELAASFSAFYRDCKVLTEDAGLTRARLALCGATKSVIAAALGLLGVGAPERM